MEAISRFSGVFGRIIVVSNQQGVGKGLMTEQQVSDLHNKMLKEISNQGGRVDAVYFSPHLESSGSVMRKPAVGMALRARKQFPEIHFKQSVIAGDSLSDMVFGKRVGMKTVFLSDNPSPAKQNPRLIDYFYTDLKTFADAL
jgi:histidinol-phosphate phosphatase family protein